jgi:hypothetical protein
MTAFEAHGTLLHVGQRLASSVCSTNVVVLDPGSATEPPTCGGAQMKAGSLIPCSDGDKPCSDMPVHSVAGSIYWDEATGTQLQCTRSGSGDLRMHGSRMVVVAPTLRRRALQYTDRPA